MARPVDEWVGKHPNQKVPRSVDVRVKKRQSGRCAKCGRQFDLKNPGERDHNVALKLGGEHRESNFVFLCEIPCHSQKTKADMKEIALVRKGEAKQYHVKRPPKKPWPKRPKAPKIKTAWWTQEPSGETEDGI